MNAKEKANEIYTRFLNELNKESEVIVKEFIGLNMKAIMIQSALICRQAKQCAKISIREVKNTLWKLDPQMYEDMWLYRELKATIPYWNEVEEEINKIETPTIQHP